jgi:transposase
VRRIEVISAAGGRRVWSDAEKARILEETLEPGAVVSVIARRHGLTPQQVFGWRRQARHAGTCPPPLSFVPAVVEAPLPEIRAGAPPQPLAPAAWTGIEVEFAGATVRIGSQAGVDAITAVIRALKAAP